MTEIISDVLGFLDSKRKEISPEYVRNGKPVYTIRTIDFCSEHNVEFVVIKPSGD